MHLSFLPSSPEKVPADPAGDAEPPGRLGSPLPLPLTCGQRAEMLGRGGRHSARGWRAAMQGTRTVLVFHYQDSANKTRLFSCELENRRGHYLVKLSVALLRVPPRVPVPRGTLRHPTPGCSPGTHLPGDLSTGVCVCAYICVTFHNPLLNAATH